MASFPVACGGRPEVVHVASLPPPVAAAAFAEAVADLDAGGARRLATTDDEGALAEAVAGVTSGRSDRVEAATRSFPPASRWAPRALELRKSALVLRGAWAELAALGEPDAAPLAAVASEAPRGRQGEPVGTWQLGRSFTGGPVVGARVGGHPASLWIDTGASITVLSERVAEAGRVRRRARATATFGATGAGAHSDVGVGSVDSLCLGPFAETHLPVAIAPPAMTRFDVLFVNIVDVDGILGWDVLRSLDVTLDGSTAALRRPAPCEDGAPLFWAGLPIVAGHTPNGRRFLVGIDTGAGRSFLTAKGAAKLEAERDAGRDAPFTFAVRHAAVSLSGAVEDAPRGNPSLDAVMGSDVLRGAAMRIAGASGCAELAARR